MCGYKTIQQVIKERSNENNKGIVFISEKDEFFSYSDIYGYALNIVTELQKRKVSVKSEIIIPFDDEKKFIISIWGCLLGGYIPVPIPLKTVCNSFSIISKIRKNLINPYIILDEELNKFCFDNKDININKVIVNTNEFLTKNYEKNLIDTSFEDIALIQFSSGSTGEPKGVALSNKNIYSNIMSILSRGELKSKDNFLSWMPLTHNMGLIGFHFMPLINNSNQCIMKTKCFTENPTMWLEKIEKYGINVTCTPNYGIKHLLNSIDNNKINNLDLSSLKIIYNGGEPVDIGLCNNFNRVMETFKLSQLSLKPAYGLAEATVGVSIPNKCDTIEYIALDKEYKEVELDSKECTYKFAKLGCAVESIKIRITNDNNEILEEAQLGNIEVSGESASIGYYNDAKSTETILTDDMWIKTGDIGMLKDGNLVVTGRSKDIMFINGKNYYLRDIEELCNQILNYENDTVAVSIFNKSTQLHELIIFILENQDIDFMLYNIISIKKKINKELGLSIKHIVPIGKIPKTVSGKVSKKQLLEDYISGKFEIKINFINHKIEDIMSKNINNKLYPEINSNLKNIWKEFFKLDNIDDDTDFFSLGGNSLMAAELISKINAGFNVDLDMVDLFERSTIKELEEFLGDLILQYQICSN